MNILSTPKGLVVIFESMKELHGVIKHLSGMAEWAETENIPAPYLYSMYDDRIPEEEIQVILDKIKK